MAKGILGRKLGMTQVFDPETGRVTPVTVIEAGPCPVVQVRTEDADGYVAVQLAFEPVADRKLSKAERGHLAKFAVGAHRKLVEFRGGIDGAVEGETVTVALFEPGDKVKVSGIGIGKGFQGTIKRHNFGSGPVHTARTTFASPDRSARRRHRRGSSKESRWPAEWAGSASLSSDSPCTRSTPSGTCCWSRARSRDPRTASSR